MASIELRQIAKAYNGDTVIENASFTVNDGEFVVLVGPSGCGKSTLLRMICGLEEISSGEIFIDGKSVNDVRARDRDIAMVFQSYALYPHMNVEKNMGFSLRVAGRPKKEIASKVAEVAEVLELTPLLKRKPGQLSGGQRQRVAMGRAIVRDPTVFLFDEPLSNLDAQLRVQMRSEINALQDHYKTTTVYVTHDQVEAMTMADRIVVLRAGNVEQVGAPLELFDHPVNRFVAQFIGSPKMNLIDGELTRDGDQVRFIAGEFSTALPKEYAPHAGKRVSLGIRPEDIALSNPTDKYSCPATVKLVEATGSETMVMLNISGHEFQGVFKERIAQTRGAELTVCFDINKWHVFDLDTEDRL